MSIHDEVTADLGVRQEVVHRHSGQLAYHSALGSGFYFRPSRPPVIVRSQRKPQLRIVPDALSEFQSQGLAVKVLLNALRQDAGLPDTDSTFHAAQVSITRCLKVI